MKDATLPRMVFDRARRQPLRTALRHKQQGAYRAITAAALTESVTLYGRALLALGLARGDRVGIMAPNGPQWVYAGGSVLRRHISTDLSHRRDLGNETYPARCGRPVSLCCSTGDHDVVERPPRPTAPHEDSILRKNHHK